jgi:superfamily I DNA/RNA helicase
MTRRCGKRIVVEARTLVPDFEAFEHNPPGNVGVNSVEKYGEVAKAGDMILCRVNAPLVSQCFRFLKEGRKATIQGRDVAEGLIGTLKRMDATSVPDLVERLGKWMDHEKKKENAKKNPSDYRLVAIEDRYACLTFFCEDMATVDAVIARINKVFTDDPHATGLRLSSIHKAKGLEADTVFLLQLPGASVPHPMAKTDWEIEQETNLKYVAITRAIKELIYVTGKGTSR